MIHPLALLLSLTACTADKLDDDPDDSGTTPTGTDDTGGTSGPSDSAGTIGYDGSATATLTDFDGLEEWWFQGEDGADLCRVRGRLISTGVRTDCGGCEWAFDLVQSETELVTEGDPGCADLAGVSDPTQLDGRAVSYGYDADYFGHGKVLMVVIDGEWQASSFASWDEGTGAFLYSREDGTFLY